MCQCLHLLHFFYCAHIHFALLRIRRTELRLLRSGSVQYEVWQKGGPCKENDGQAWLWTHHTGPEHHHTGEGCLFSIIIINSTYYLAFSPFLVRRWQFETLLQSGLITFLKNEPITILFVLFLWQASNLGHLKPKSSWATYINWLALMWDHHIPHSYGHHRALLPALNKHSLLTRQKLN